jgi:hypothetical protein
MVTAQFLVKLKALHEPLSQITDCSKHENVDWVRKGRKVEKKGREGEPIQIRSSLCPLRPFASFAFPIQSRTRSIDDQLLRVT